MHRLSFRGHCSRLLLFLSQSLSLGSRRFEVSLISQQWAVNLNYCTLHKVTAQSDLLTKGGVSEPRNICGTNSAFGQLKWNGFFNEITFNLSDYLGKSKMLALCAVWFPVVDSIDVLLSTVKDWYIQLKSQSFLIKYRVVFNSWTLSHAFHHEECDLGVSGLWIMGGIETFSGRSEKTGGMRGWETDDKLKALRGHALRKGGERGSWDLIGVIRS